MLNRVFVFRLDNDSLARRTMMSSIESTSTFDSKTVPHRSRYARSPTAPRKWSAYAAAVLARLRDLAPYAAIELVLPGGSLMALLLWLYRRHKKEPRELYEAVETRELFHRRAI
jgi:sensor c-di-GMP phosphodiesterase-like protein